MNILVVTILYGLSLGSSFGKWNSPLSQRVLHILQGNVPKVIGTAFSKDDGASSNLNDKVDQSNDIFPEMIKELMTEALVASNYNLKGELKENPSQGYSVRYNNLSPKRARRSSHIDDKWKNNCQPKNFRLAGMCVRFSNLNVRNKHFTGCAELEVQWIRAVVVKVNLGCFKIPPRK